MQGPDAMAPRWTRLGALRLARFVTRLRRRRTADAPAVDPTPAHRRPFARGGNVSSLEVNLKGLVGALRAQDAVIAAPPTVARAALVALVAVAVARMADLGPVGAIVATVAGAWATVIIARAYVRRIGPFEAARRADRQVGLRAQLATALELVDAGADGELAALQVGGASRAARAIVPAAALPAVPADPRWRRDASTRLGTALAALVATVAILAWPDPPAAALPIDEPTLVLADARAPGEAPPPGMEEVTSPDRRGLGDAVEALGARPSDVGSPATGLLGGSQEGEQGAAPQPGQAPGDAPRAGQEGLQNPSASARAEALQQLGDALRQAQSSRAAGESLRRGDATRAAEQLAQLADQVSRLGPGERESLANAFERAATVTQANDRQVSDAARQASQALTQFRDLDARDAIRREANAVRQAGEASVAQREREARASDLARGAQPSLPRGEQPGAASAANGRTPEQATLGDQPGEARAEGGPGRQGNGSDEGGLGNLEQQLRAGGGGGDGRGTGQGPGIGTGAGGTGQGPATRLEAQAVPVSVEAQEGDGPSTWRPPRSDTPAVAPPPAPAVAGGPVSSAPIGAGADVNAIPREHAGSVRRYFTPDPEGAPSGPRPAPARGLVDARP